MRTKESDWFEVKFQYSKVQENGSQKIVTELYVVDALSFAEAEKKIVDEMDPYMADCEYEVKAIARAKYKEIWFSDKNTDDEWYLAKLQFITIDEKSNKEKKSNVFYMVQADSFDTAKKYIDDTMNGTMIDYTIASLKETAIMGVFEHEGK